MRTCAWFWQRVLLVVAFALVASSNAPAEAQSSGGAVGGGSWGGGGGGGGGRDSSRSSRSSGLSDDDDDHDDGDEDDAAGGDGWKVLLTIQLAGAVLYLPYLVVRRLRRRAPLAEHSPDVSPPIRPGESVADVTEVRIVLDAQVRPYVQRELDRIARTADTATNAGLVAMLSEVSVLLRRVREAWCYGTARNFDAMPLPTARAAFLRQVDAARVTYRDELVRNSAGTLATTTVDGVTPRSHEGPGLVMVTIVVAAPVRLHTVDKVANGDALARALEVFSLLAADELHAVEVVWTPADPDDRMSSLELERVMRGIPYFRIEGAVVGRAFCAYCGGAYPAEAVACVHCGAPATVTTAPGDMSPVAR